jgi:hypothetical protein
MTCTKCLCSCATHELRPFQTVSTPLDNSTDNMLCLTCTAALLAFIYNYVMCEATGPVSLNGHVLAWLKGEEK